MMFDFPLFTRLLAFPGFIANKGNAGNNHIYKRRIFMKGHVLITLVVLLVAVSSVLLVALVDTYREKQRWRDAALGNARKRLRRDDERDAEIGLINKRAAAKINELNICLQDMRDENSRLRKINENYRKQIERAEKHE